MANEEQVKILRRSVDEWNAWRKKNSDVEIEFTGASLRQAHLNGADLRNANLYYADLRDTDLSNADLTHAELNYVNLGGASLNSTNLSNTNLYHADLRSADLVGANLRNAYLRDANLSGASLRDADLSGADLIGTVLVATQLENAILSNCRIFGISAWKVNLEGAIQSNLIITNDGEPIITVDNLEIAQFVHLLIHNEKLRDVIDTITSKAVLILGRFTDERKAVLEAIREELRKRGYIPILFDFEKPSSRDLTETMSTLAHLSRFIIADLTDPNSIPHELATIVPHLRHVAIQPIMLQGRRPYPMFKDFQDAYHWVLPIHEYETQAQLIAELAEKVIAPAEAKVNELRPKA